jgi:hypothetical protein
MGGETRRRSRGHKPRNASGNERARGTLRGVSSLRLVQRCPRRQVDLHGPCGHSRIPPHATSAFPGRRLRANVLTTDLEAPRTPWLLHPHLGWSWEAPSATVATPCRQAPPAPRPARVGKVLGRGPRRRRRPCPGHRRRRPARPAVVAAPRLRDARLGRRPRRPAWRARPPAGHAQWRFAGSPH